MKKLLIGILAMLALVFIANTNFYAEEKEQEPSKSRVLRIIIGEPKIISVKVPTRIVINNPNIVDVLNVSAQSLTITPKAIGTTPLIIWDKNGEHSYQVKVLPANLDEIKKRIDSLLAVLDVPDVRTKKEEDEGTIFLLGSVKEAADKEKIFTALGDLKKFTTDLINVREEEASVDIDVSVLEVSKDAERNMGFTYPTSIALTESAGMTFVNPFNMFRVSQLQRAAFTFTLDLLESEGKVRILSRPRLSCQSGKEANLLVGGQKPTFSSTQVVNAGTATTIDYKDFGVSLKIKPVVTAEKRIKIALTVDVTDISGAAITIGGTSTTALAYPTTIRRATTELFLDNGQTMAIGGLITRKRQEDIQRVPWASNLPLIGTFFRTKDIKEGGGQGVKGDTELFITLTPTIVSLEPVAEKKEEKAKEGVKERKEIQAQPKVKAMPSAVRTATHSAATAEENIPAPLHNYKVIVQRRILDKVKYPLQAKEAGFQGRVKISLYLSYKGDLLDVKLKETSGYNVLDNSAMAAARSVIGYPPFPSALTKENIWVDIPIDYQLN